MSTTRVIFILVCLIVAIMVFTIGIIIQKNNPDSKYSVTNALNPKALRKRRLKLPKNPSSYLTLFLIILLLFLFLIFKGK
jgi:hypothetical protein